MQDLINRFDFNSPKLDSQIIVCAIIIWLTVMVCGITSVRSQGWTRRKQLFWVLLIVALPLVGLLAYLPFAIHFEENAQYFGWKKQKY